MEKYRDWWLFRNSGRQRSREVVGEGFLGEVGWWLTLEVFAAGCWGGGVFPFGEAAWGHIWMQKSSSMSGGLGVAQWGRGGGLEADRKGGDSLEGAENHGGS